MGNRYSVVLLDARGTEYDLERQEIAAAQADLTLARCKSEQEAIGAAREADVLLDISLPVTRSVLQSAPHCLGVVRYGVGFQDIDLDAATELGVVVSHVPDYGTDEVATHALALLLAAGRKIVRLDRALRAGARRRVPLPPMGPIQGETLGLIGFGRIARTLARKASCLGMRVVAYDPYVDPRAVESDDVSMLPWDSVLQEADYLSLHVPLLPETRHWLNADRIRLLKPTCYVVNTSRGGVIDEAALLAAQQDGRLAGAALDVLEQEPPSPDNPLLGLDTTIVTPHSAFFSDRSIIRLARSVGQAATALLRGDLPPHIINPDVELRRRMPRPLPET